ncbi:MAG: pyridoxamine 5'-phosphate oxidase family protein [Piscinibacter sp.]|nr:pyridoxamine 5'-phosphate oxidase family protein [Piscinibacter sp.]
MGTAKPPLIGPEQAALLARPISANVATRDATHRPHLTRAVGFRLSADLRRVTVFLSASTSGSVLDDLRANRQIAVVFSEPATHRTVQLKGGDAIIAAAGPDDALHLRAYREAFGAAIGELGYPAQVAQTILEVTDIDLLAVHFTPQAGFDQTPGPRAGQALATGAR